MDNKKFVMALDAGTSSSRAIVFDHDRRIVAVAQREFRQIYPQPGWVEHDPVEIWDTQLAVAREAMAKAGATASSLAAIGITNQRETTVVWDRETGRPVYNAIVWQCRRTSDFCDELKKRGLADSIRATTGLVPDAYFSAPSYAGYSRTCPARAPRPRPGACFSAPSTRGSCGTSPADACTRRTFPTLRAR